MTVTDSKTIDLIGVERSSGKVILSIVDHLEWDSDDHLFVLQDKLNTYIEFIESGEIYDSCPQAKDKTVGIELVVCNSPNQEGILFLQRVKAIIERRGYEFRIEKHPKT